MAGEPSLTLTVYTAEPGSPSAEGLRLLASWTAAPDVTARRPAAGRDVSHAA
ncbi:hypothetical protein ACHZ98_34230 [Streptomyces sp. MAR4 CNY-716]